MGNTERHTSPHYAENMGKNSGVSPPDFIHTLDGQNIGNQLHAEIYKNEAAGFFQR